MCIRDSPYTAQMIATLTRHQIGTVERALEIFRQLGLGEQLDSGAFYMTDIELMIGQSSTEAERKRAARLENKALLDVYKRQALCLQPNLWENDVGRTMRIFPAAIYPRSARDKLVVLPISYLLYYLTYSQSTHVSLAITKQM